MIISGKQLLLYNFKKRSVQEQTKNAGKYDTKTFILPYNITQKLLYF